MSKKRIVAIILGCLLGVAAIGAIVAAVVVGTKQEGHSYSEEWAFDETHHWHACTDDGCDVVSGKDAHIWGEGEELKAATCTEAGVIAYTCTQCGYQMEEMIDLSEHQYGAWEVTVPASCSAKGERQRKCEECGDIQTEELDLLEHALVQHEAQEPTCTQPGWDAYVTCSLCDYTTYAERAPLGHKPEREWLSDANGHWQVCSVCGRAVEAAPHISSGAATETQPEVCATCGYILSPALEHTHTPDITRWYCDETSHWRRCMGCEERLMAAEHSGGTASCTEQAVCEICSEPYGGLSAHSFTQYISNHDATCTEDGTKTAKCDNCAQTDTQPDAGTALGHSFEEEWSSSLEGHFHACVRPGCTERRDLEEHTYTESEKAASCTEDGYRQYFCEKCGYLYKTDIIFAYGHTFGAWETVMEATCTAAGSEQRVCEHCGETQTRGLAVLQHDYVVTSVEALAGGEQKTYECRICGHSYTVEDASAADAFPNETITHCPSDFTFDVLFDGTLTELKERVSIIDAYFEGTEYEFSGLFGVVQPYQVQQKGDGVWSILPESPYEAGLTYRATVSGGVQFADYNGSVLYFSIDKEPITEIEVRKEVLFLGAMEEASPGYFPYELEFSEDSDTMYLTLPKIDGLAVGDILSVGPARNMDEVMSGGAEENHFGKIAEIYSIPGGGYMVRLGYPMLEEIFARLDVYVEDLIDFESADVEFADDIEEQAVQSLYASEDFVEFLGSVSVAADTYLSENNYDTKAASARSILDRLSITPSVSVKGTSVKVGLTGAIDIPIEAQSQTLGNIRISFSTTADVSFRFEAGLKLKYVLWVIPVGIKYFDIRLVQQDTFDFTFGVEFDMNYTLSRNSSKYVLYNSQTGGRTLHIASCRVMKNADDSRKQQLSRDAVLPYLQDASVKECGVCKAKTRLNTREVFLLNEETRTFHILSCSYAPSGSNAKLSLQYSGKLMEQGYSPCGHCQPDQREEQVFESYMFDSVNYADWNGTVSQIKNWTNSTGTSDRSESGFTLCRLVFPIVIFTANLEVKLNLNFRIEAAISYHYEISHENVYGFRLEGGKARTYIERYQQEPINELDAIGKAEFRAGIGLDAYVSVLGLSSILRAGIYGEAGIYAEAAGVAHLSSEGNNYAAAYLEAGLYAKVQAYYKAFFWSGEANIVSAEWPIWVMGYDRAYHSFVNYFDELSINGNTSLARAGLLDVYYFDLRTLTDKTGTLSANGVKGQYSISFELENGEYCSVRNGMLYVDADAPCTFTDTLTISVEGASTWKEYVRGNSVFYLDEVSVPIVYRADTNHEYAETSRIDSTCTDSGSVTYTCSRCGDSYTETIPEKGHTVVIDEAVEATCTQPGLTEGSHCSVCEAVIVAQEVVPAKEHNYKSEVTKQPTCTAAGERTYTCTRCEDSYTEAIQALNHALEYVAAVEATCEKAGSVEHWTCSRCDKNFADDKAAVELTDITIPAKGHTPADPVRENVKEPTCTEKGSYEEVVYCEVCKKELSSKTVITDELGHSFTNYVSDGDATCTKDGTETATCDHGCGETATRTDEGSALGHSLEYVAAVEATCEKTGSVEHWTCSRCHKNFADDKATEELVNITIPAKGHTPGEAVKENVKEPTCTEKGSYEEVVYCEVCKKELSSKTVVTDELGHSFTQYFPDGNATCEEDGTETAKCDRCDATDTRTDEGSAKGHNWESHYTSNDDSHWIACSRCDAKDKLGEHTFENGICSVCGMADPDATVGSEGLEFIYVQFDKEPVYSVSDIGSCTDVDIIIPSVHDGKLVEGIASSAFSGCGDLKSITLPDSITNIGSYAFSGCGDLKSITLPDSITNIGSYAFSGCSSLTSISIPASVTNIGEYVFSSCSGLTNVIFADNSWLTSIGRGAFSGCSSLTSIILPDGVSSISDRMFYNCSRLERITIPVGVMSIGHNAFQDCISLKSINIPEGVTSIGEEAFRGCSSLTGNITIPKGVTTIYSMTFMDCSSLDGVEIPDTVTSIGYRAFWYCGKFTSINIPAGVTSIGEEAFAGCEGLEKVYITDIAAWCAIDFRPSSFSVIHITDSNPLHYANNLYLNGELVTDLKIPESVTSISGGAFSNCWSLTSVTLPDDVVSIGIGAFYRCINLESINIPDKTSVIAAGAFRGCSSLKSIHIPECVPSINEYVFYDCSSLANVNIPDGVTNIGDRAFFRCNSLTSINIPSSIISIGYEAFSESSHMERVYISDIAAWCAIDFANESSNPLYFNHNLYLNDELVTDLTIPEGVTSIGNYAFGGCTSLTSIDIPDSVTSIGDWAFAWCKKLASIKIPDSVTSIGIGAFADCDGLVSIIVSEGNPVYHSAGNCLIETATGTLIAGCSNSIIPTDGSVTSIGGYAFSGCDNLTSVTIPNSVTSIGDSAFEDCYGLTSITIPDSVTSIGERAFYRCDSLTSVYYTGAEEQWNAISIGGSNSALTDADIYYYSESEPSDASGNYWHYDENGTPVVW